MRDPRFAERNAWEHHNPARPEEVEKACAAARAVAECEPEAALLTAARDGLSLDRPNAWRAFHDAFVDAVRANEKRREAWSRAIGKAFAAARDGLSGDVQGKRDEEVLLGEIRRWKEQRNPFSAWKWKQQFIAFRRRGFDYWGGLLIRVAPRDGLEVLETLPYPSLMAEVLHLTASEDRDLIQELIQQAPPVFDRQGNWVAERSVAALLVVDLIADHATKLHDAVDRSRPALVTRHPEVRPSTTLDHLEKEVLQPWMLQTFKVLLQRSDGLRIALAYLGHLSGGHLSRARQDGWNGPDAALAVLCEALVQARIGIAEVRTAWESAERSAREGSLSVATRNRVIPRASRGKKSDCEGEGARVLHTDGLPFVFGASVMMESLALGAADLELFWSWLEELLIGRDPGLEVLVYGRSLTDVPQRFGARLSGLPAVDDQFEEAYRRLEPQRRRALFGYRYSDEPYRDLESVFLLRVGLSVAANWFVRDKAEAAQRLFFAVYDHARRLWLTNVLDTEGLKEQLVSSCFAFMPMLFPESLGDALKRVIPPIANDARMLGEASSNLTLNGCEPNDVATLVSAAGGDLIAALDDAHQWSQLTGRDEDFPEHFLRLADALGINFSKPIAPRETSDDEAFHRSIPWGASLTGRLRRDGYDPMRLVRMDQAGTTWLLQATATTVLRDRFSLAPQLRILAVNGKVRGQDLWRALQEPAGADLVDPDLIVVAGDAPDLGARLARVAGPWGQRVPWQFDGQQFPPLLEQLESRLPEFDLFERRDPVRGRAFIGRRQEVDMLATKLLQGRAVGVFGLRKVGKTSLLHAVTEALDPIAARLARATRDSCKADDDQPDAVVVFLDVQSLIVKTRDVLAERLCDGLDERLRLTGLRPDALVSSEASPLTVSTVTAPRPSKDPLENLRKLLSQTLARPESPTVCFLIDEYDLLFGGYGGQPGVEGLEQIFAVLRSLGQSTGRVSLALVGRDSSFVDRPHLNDVTNPLLGWVEKTHLGPFSQREAGELLQRLGKRVCLDINETTVDRAMLWTGGHPLLLRQFGSAVLEAHRGDQEDGSMLEHAISQFLQRDAVYTICGEIEALLGSSFPEALALYREVASAPDYDGPGILERHDRTTAKLVFDLGLLCGTPSAPRMPFVYRDYFGSRGSVVDTGGAE